MLKCVTIILLLFSFNTGFTQCATFRLTAQLDTINCVDNQGNKQGKWKLDIPALRGQQAYEAEGVFVNNQKEGKWKRYNLLGDLIAEENYKWGLINGIARYFTIHGLEREENWRAASPEKKYDTVDVQDIFDPNKYEKVVVKLNGNSLRHGTWKYYNPLTGQLQRTERWILDELQNGTEVSRTNSNYNKLNISSNAKDSVVKPKQVLEFEKKNKGKTSKVRDGRTGGK